MQNSATMGELPLFRKVSTKLEQREIARLKRLLKRGPRLRKAERGAFLRALLKRRE
jgi:hypothetical protein